MQKGNASDLDLGSPLARFFFRMGPDCRFLRRDVHPVIAALVMGALMAVLGVSCSSMRENADEEAESGPRKLSDRISNVDYNKEFDTTSLNVDKSFAGESDSPFQNARTDSRWRKKSRELESIEGNRYNTERFAAESANEQKKRKWYHFGRDRDRQEKSAWIGEREASQTSETFKTQDAWAPNKTNAIFGTRSERDITDREINSQTTAYGDPTGPVIIREPTMTEGDVRALLGGG